MVPGVPLPDADCPVLFAAVPGAEAAAPSVGLRSLPLLKA